jgi:secreted PhoX family phosphatase
MKKVWLSGLSLALLFTGCATTDSKDLSITTPTTDKEKREVRAAKKLMLNGKALDVKYTTLIRSGDKVGNEIFGLIKDKDGNPIKSKDGSNFVCNNGSGPDHTSLIEKDGKIFMITQFECSPGATYSVELKQDANGNLSLTDNAKYISFAEFGGGYVHCAGSKTPWNSFLGSEEYEPDAALIDANGISKEEEDNEKLEAIAAYNKIDLKDVNPYMFGWITEVNIENGEPVAKKNFSMGRFAHELAYVMPDGKTAYLTDDGTNTMLVMYVADKKDSLEGGTLYAAKWNQTSNKGAGSADITWVGLGHLTNNEAKSYMEKNYKFSDIFNAVKPNEDKTCPTGFTSVNAYVARQECLQLKDGMNQVALALETRRFAALKGATTEFRKEEGFTFNPQTNTAYIAMSQISYGMESYSKKGKVEMKYDMGTSNDIKLAYNPCGAVYAADVKGGIKDTDGDKIDSKYVIVNMKSEVEGNPKKYDENSPYAKNKCDVDAIGNPDNVAMIDNSDWLIIGEDTKMKQNDIIWLYNVKTKDLKRFISTPYGAETTSPYWFNINGYEYMTVVTQHPYGESDKDKKTSPDDIKSLIGYVGPFKR